MQTSPGPGRLLAALHEGSPALALADGGRTLTYADLADRVDAAADVLAGPRRLVRVEAENTLESLTAYVAALHHGHVVLPTAPGSPLDDTWDADVVHDRDGWRVRREQTAHDLHPDLALLLSTSGSTRSPKLVRLSHRNIEANAASIVEYLALGPDDRALTTLPPHYCYGLSVVHSHLLAGAGLVVTEGSVVDPCTWDLARRTGVTSFAGVPYTFELLEGSGFTAPPTLRRATQAGGRMAPERVRRWAEVADRDGWDLVVMYGQTEATARMAYLPPHLAASRPHALGVAIPGGTLRIDPVPEAEPGTGELVYAGDNVMMGYACDPAYLARPAELAELRTGDLARRHPDGLLEWVGRRSRVAKCFGLRLDLDHVERLLGEHEVVGHAVEVDGRLHVLVRWLHDVEAARDLVTGTTGLPAHAVVVSRVAEVPRTAAGKVDHRALALHAATLDRRPARRPATAPGPGAVRDLYATLLDRADVTDTSTFAGLGGDSLSYVELSVRLGELGIELPPDWHRRTVADLAARATGPRRTVAADPSVLLRAAAIVAVVGTHANLWTLLGGAHLLLVLAGHSHARFRLAVPGRRSRLRATLVSVARVAAPAVVWIGLVALVAGTYRAPTVALLNGVLGSDEWTDQWQFWFLEAVVWTQVAAAAALAVPWVHRLERRRPVGLALAFLAGAVALRFLWVGWEAGPTERYTPAVVLWCFALGWAAAVARTRRDRLLVTAVAAVAVWGFFGDPVREGVVLAGVGFLVWARRVRVPAAVARLAGTLAGASLFVYLTHWQVYPHLEWEAPLLATVASFVVGIAAWRAWEALLRRLRAGAQSLTRRAEPSTTTETRSPASGGGPGTSTGHVVPSASSTTTVLRGPR